MSERQDTPPHQHWPAISAHRGGGETAPLGTWEAFRTAAAEYVEFDVRLTRDGTWVIHHDEHAGQASRRVGELHYEQLCEAAGYHVPTAPAVMELLAPRAVGHLDVKERAAETEIIGPAIDIFGADGFVVTAESVDSLRRITSFAPGVRAALSMGHPVPGWSRARGGPRYHPFDLRTIVDSGTELVSLNHQVVTGEVLRECQQNGIGVMVWTVNESALIANYLAEPRVEVLITDRPDYASRFRERVEPKLVEPRAVE